MKHPVRSRIQGVVGDGVRACGYPISCETTKSTENSNSSNERESQSILVPKERHRAMTWMQRLKPVNVALAQSLIDARYSEHYEITQEELEYLEEQVQRLQALVEKVCKETIAIILSAK